MTALEKENQELRRENKKLREEIEVYKKQRALDMSQLVYQRRQIDFLMEGKNEN